MIREKDIEYNLDWLKDNGFGGVEIAWVYPLNRMQHDTVHYTPRQAWLSESWSEIVAYAKQYADSIGLGCDFTFGTLWPSGDSQVPPAEGTYYYGKPGERQKITASWEYPVNGLVINHLDRNAFSNYAARMDEALSPAMEGSRSGIFVDSWEVETRGLWTPGFELVFQQRYGYDIRPFMDSLYAMNDPGPRYDYMKLLSEFVIHNFYIPFSENARKIGGFSRAQCSGAPVDLLSAYAVVDVPESEAMLYEPRFSRIPASAALLGGKNTVSAETFTCLYGWPRDHLGEEQTADLKMVADALFAHGVNHIIWHGKPFNPAGTDSVRFYASVHVGPSGSLAPEMAGFNAYLEKVSGWMSQGKSYSQMAVYLPTEDAWIAGEYPDSLQFPWAWGEYEMRYVSPPPETQGYQPIWVNNEMLQKGRLDQGRLIIGDAAFDCLYLDVQYLDMLALQEIVKLAKNGFPVCLSQVPVEAGHIKHPQFPQLLESLQSLPNVSPELKAVCDKPPLLEGDDLPPYWCRQTERGLLLFLANPRSKKLRFPIGYGESFQDKPVSRHLKIRFGKRSDELDLVFSPFQSILLEIPERGKIREMDIRFVPKDPVVIEGKGRGF